MRSRWASWAWVKPRAHGHASVAADLGGRRVGLNNLGRIGEDPAVAVPVVQPFAQKQHNVGLPEAPGRWVEGPIGVPEAEGVFVVQQAPGLLNGEHGDAGGLGQVLQLRRVHRIAGWIAGDDYGLLGALQ